MSDLARWSYTAPCTIWRNLGFAENGDFIGWTREVIMADYQGGMSAKIGSIGTEITVKSTFWTEFSDAKRGDFIIIGECLDDDPANAGAEEIKQVIRYADTFERTADDYAILTGA